MQSEEPLLALPWREREWLEVRGRRIVADESEGDRVAGEDTTGWIVWDASQVLLDAVAERLEQLSLQHVVELAAGTGAAAVGLAWLGAARVTATDLPPLLPRIRRTAALNGEEGRVEAAALELGDGQGLAALRPSLVCAADAVYSEGQAAALGRSLAAAGCPALLATRDRSAALSARLEAALPRPFVRALARGHVVHYMP